MAILDYSLPPVSPSQLILYKATKGKSNITLLLDTLMTAHCKILKRSSKAGVSSLFPPHSRGTQYASQLAFVPSYSP